MTRLKTILNKYKGKPVKFVEEETIKDNVNHPAHYTQGSIECIDAIEAALTPEEFRGYCKGNALKYLWRERSKGNETAGRICSRYRSEPWKNFSSVNTERQRAPLAS